LGVSLVNASNLFFGCTMAPATVSSGNITTTGTGSVACVQGTDDNVATLACTWAYAGLTSDVTAAHLHVGSATTASGPVTFGFDATSTPLLAASGTVYQKFIAASTTPASPPYWTMQNSLSFADQITQCASGTGCYFNLHTTMYTSGELRCEMAPLTATYAYDVDLKPTPASDSAVNNSASTGHVWIAMANVSSATNAARAWAYEVQFSTYNAVTASHLHQATTVGGSGGIVVTFDQGSQRSTGNFVGVALEGVTTAAIPDGQPKSNFPIYPSNLDSAIANHYCYVNVHTVANPGGELRANISPEGSSASQVAVTLLAVVLMVSSWVSM